MSGFDKMVVNELKGHSTSAEEAILASQLVRWESSLAMHVENLHHEFEQMIAQHNAALEQYRDEPELAAILVNSNTPKLESKSAECIRAERRLAQISRQMKIQAGVDAGHANFYRRAIEHHKANKQGHYDENDEALWAALSGLWKFS